MTSAARADGAVGLDARDGGEISERHGVVHGDETVRGRRVVVFYERFALARGFESLFTLPVMFDADHGVGLDERVVVLFYAMQTDAELH